MTSCTRQRERELANMLTCILKTDKWTWVDMAKTLKIRDDVYERLAAIKGKDESFSQLIERLAERRGSLVLLKRIHGSNEFESAAEREGLLRQATAKREERRL
jgi:predicted CopG family antitoxin